MIAYIFITVALSCVYITTRMIYLIAGATLWYEILWASTFLAAEIFGIIHSISYFSSVMLSLHHEGKSPALVKKPHPLAHYPPIAVVVPSYHEPISILKDTLLCFYNLSYPNKHLYLLDDSRYDKPWDTEEKVAAYRREVEELCRWMGVNLFRRKWRKAKAGIINDFLHFRMDGATFENLEFSQFQTDQPLEKEKYIAIFDADMNPFPDFLDPIITDLEENPRLAFVQTPQYYSNFETNRVARASGLQQVIFFEYLCDTKGIKDAMFCCGSNVVLRIEALLSVGGFDETSVTEDFATSIIMHLKHWSSAYYNRVSAFGMGPEDLGSFFKQQSRWALGTLVLARKLPLLLLRHFNKMSIVKWWEYFISSTHYLTGWYFFIMFTFPILYIFFNVPSFFLPSSVYIAILLPYITSSIIMFVWTMALRNYQPIYMLMSILISAISFPIYMKATVCALFGIKRPFVVTPKGQQEALLLRDLWPQVIFLIVGVAGITWALERMFYERDILVGVMGNMVWCLYNTLVLSTIIYFNNPTNEPWIQRIQKKSASS